MMQIKPAARALRERLREPQVMRLAAGLTLLAPVVLFSATNDARQPAAAAAAVKVAMPAMGMQAGEVNPVFQDWLAVRQREDSVRIATEFAQEFGISKSLAADIHEAAVDVGIDPAVAFGLVQAESSFRTRAVSPVGAIGLTQVMPATAREVEPGTTRSDLMNAKTNLRIGFKYLRRLIDKYGNEDLALTAYNRGPGTVNRLLRQGRDPDNGYAEKVKTGESQRHVRLMNAKFGR